MINAAHIGIGISGFEGQQAVKASDYAIGKFKFLKNLLLVHGRESYRRNSFATGYIFYKNILETAPIFYFGMFSIFSGTMLYHLLLYNMFNPVFTSVPIVWFSTMDFEHSKEKLLSDPSLYKYGMRNLHFNTRIFLRWVFYGFWQSFLILTFTLLSIARQSASIHGKYGGYVDAGDFTFACIVVVANVKILVSAYEVSIGVIGTVLLSISLYVAGHAFVSNSEAFMLDDQFGSLQNLTYFPAMYLAMFLFICMFGLIDHGIDKTRRYLKIRRLANEEAEEFARKQAERKDPANVRRHLSAYRRKY